MVKAIRVLLILAALGVAAPSANAGLFGKSEGQKASHSAKKKARKYNDVSWGNEWKRVFRMTPYQRPHYLEMF